MRGLTSAAKRLVSDDVGSGGIWQSRRRGEARVGRGAGDIHCLCMHNFEIQFTLSGCGRKGNSVVFFTHTFKKTKVGTAGKAAGDGIGKGGTTKTQ